MSEQNEQSQNETQPNETQPAATETVTPQASSIKSMLNNAFKGVADEIKQHEDEIDKRQSRVAELRGDMKEALAELNKTFGIKEERKPAAKPAVRRKRKETTDGKSIKELILEFLQQHSQAKTSEIRAHLQQNGRDTNPGVELNRLVKNKQIKNIERGLYSLS